jgi:hypothetical protein
MYCKKCKAVFVVAAGAVAKCAGGHPKFLYTKDLPAAAASPAPPQSPSPGAGADAVASAAKAAVEAAASPQPAKGDWMQGSSPVLTGLSLSVAFELLLHCLHRRQHGTRLRWRGDNRGRAC